MRSVQSSRWGGWRTVCRGSGFTGGLHHLLLYLPTLSGKRTPSPTPLYCLFLYPATSLRFQTYFLFHFLFSLCLFSFLSSYYCTFICVCACVSALTQCVCTLSPSPSKLSKPVPLDNLQLPLAPGLVTHTVSLYWPLWECDCMWDTLNWTTLLIGPIFFCFGVCVAPWCVRVASETSFSPSFLLTLFKVCHLIQPELYTLALVCCATAVLLSYFITSMSCHTVVHLISRSDSTMLNLNMLIHTVWLSVLLSVSPAVYFQVIIPASSSSRNCWALSPCCQSKPGEAPVNH